MTKVVFAAFPLTAITVILHGLGAAASAQLAIRRRAASADRPGPLGAEPMLARLVRMLLLLHRAEAVVWAAFYVLVGVLPDLETAAYFSLTSYTTVGYRDVVLPEPWRLLGPLAAAVGVFMLGGSTGILVGVIGTMYRQLFPDLAGGADPTDRKAP